MRTVPFSLGELKILDTYISRINAADESRTTVIFTKEEYEELMGITSVDYRTLKKYTEGMLGKVVTLEMPNKSFLQFVLFTAAYYHLDDYGVPIIELSCSPQAKDLFFCIGKYHYFKYALENIIDLTRKSSYLLYIYILPNRYRGSWTISLDELRDKVLDCKGRESYHAFKEFKRAVLDPATKEINEKTDCHFDYEIVKRGRKVTEIRFIYHSNNDIDIPEQLTLFDEPLGDETTDEPDETKYSNELLAFLAESCDNRFSEPEMQVIFDIVREIIPTVGDRIERYNFLRKKYNELMLQESKRTIKHPFEYFKKMLEKEL
jgi:plasmid replication initiation protein